MENQAMNTTTHSEDFYKTIRENRMMMYSKPKRYFNRDEQQGSTFRFLFLVEAIVFVILIAAAGSGMAQTTQDNSQLAMVANSQQPVNIFNYNTIYNSGKVFVSWTSKNEPED